MLEDRINDSLIKMKQKNIKSLHNLNNFYGKSSSVMNNKARELLKSGTASNAIKSRGHMRDNWIPAKATTVRKPSPSKSPKKRLNTNKSA